MSKELAKTDETKAVVPIIQAKTYIEQIAPKFLEVKGLKLQFEKEFGFAMQILRKNNSLLSIAVQDKVELQTAIINVALTGLSLNPVLKYAYLVPRGGKICLEPSYMGFIKILTDAGSVKQVWADVIREGDSYQVHRGTHPRIEHGYNLQDVRGEIIGCYAVALLADGTTQFEVLQKVEVDNIRRRSMGGCVWTTDESEMYKKTAIRRLFKYLPKTEIPEQTLNTLSVFDNNHELEETDNSVKGVNNSKEKARLLAFLERTNSIEELNAKRAEFERHGLSDTLDGKIADLKEYLSEGGK